MCGPAYSENNLNFRLCFFYKKLDTVKEGILLELVLNITWANQRKKFVLGMHDTFLDPRLQRSKHSNNSDRSLEQQDMQTLGWFLIPKTIVVREDRKSCLKIHCKQ